MKLNAELSPRETEIAELLAWGASKKETADRLFISPRTVENTARTTRTIRAQRRKGREEELLTPFNITA